MKSIHLTYVMVALSIIGIALWAFAQNSQLKDNPYNLVLPDGLKDCQLYNVIGQGGLKSIPVIRCPNSQTTIITK